MRILLTLVLLTAAAAEQEKPRQLVTGFRFTEGPAVDASGNLFFTDVPNERIHKVDVEGKLTTFREKSGQANGLMFNAAGELVACEGGTGRVVAISPDGKKVRVLADKFRGKRFNAPNDLVIDRRGGVYFTDPEFGRELKKPQVVFAVYYIEAPGKVKRVIEALPKPNGIILSPDEKTLYVVSSQSANVMKYPVESPGRLGDGRIFCKLRAPRHTSYTGGDGLTVDTEGTLYITSLIGIQVVSVEGKLLRVLEFPAKPSNVTFGGKARDTLYVTTRNTVYTLRVKAKGHVFPAGKSD